MSPSKVRMMWATC